MKWRENPTKKNVFGIFLISVRIKFGIFPRMGGHTVLCDATETKRLNFYEIQSSTNQGKYERIKEIIFL